MPAKRKHTADTTAEEPAPKRTLRSSRTPAISTPEPTKAPPRTRTRAPAKKLVAPVAKPTLDDELPQKEESVEAPPAKGKARGRPKKAVLDSKTNIQEPCDDAVVVTKTQKASRKQVKKSISNQGATCGDPSEADEIHVGVVDDSLEVSCEATQIPTIELEDCLAAQKRALLQNLQASTLVPVETDSSTQTANDIASQQLADLLLGTIERAEGNSCLILGPRGSGKSAILDRCLNADLQKKAIVIRLCGWLQSTDRHALRELAIQLLHQTGATLFSGLDDNAVAEETEGDNAGVEGETVGDNVEGQQETVDKPSSPEDTNVPGITLPPASQLHSLIPVLSSLKRPVIVVLDAFDLFALHPRQSLLYCLLDAVQNCRASPENKGISVIGMSSRIDTIQLLEKRVKSRFSGRTFRTGPPTTIKQWEALTRHLLLPKTEEAAVTPKWRARWTLSVERFLKDKNVQTAFLENFSFTRDFSVLRRILSDAVVQLNTKRPFLDFDCLKTAMTNQRRRPSHPNLHLMSYPALCLLVAISHVETSGHTAFTFEMLLERFQDQVRASSSAPVQVNGGSIGMMRCSREIMMSAFESLVAGKLLVGVNATTATTPKAFVKYRCAVEREDIRKAIEGSGQTNLKKWLTKS